MDAVQRTRRGWRPRHAHPRPPKQGAQPIGLSMTRETSQQSWGDAKAVRAVVRAAAPSPPARLPPKRAQGDRRTGRRRASATWPGRRWRQRRLQSGAVSTLRPSFVMPSMAGGAEAGADPLRRLASGVPPWLGAEDFGHDAHSWARPVERLGRQSLVGTTGRAPAQWPQPRTADEPPTAWGGEKAALPLTTGEGGGRGIAWTESADDAHLRDA